MGIVTVGRENSTPIRLYYEDHGSGPAVVLVHGWPLDSRSWEPQVHPLLSAGYRVITYDRRGLGRSSRPTAGYDFDTLAADLDALLTEPDLHDVTLIGFSLGTGEQARYAGAHGTGRLKRLVFIESLAPSFAKSADNPLGVDPAGVAGVQQAILDDRFAWWTGLLRARGWQSLQLDGSPAGGRHRPRSPVASLGPVPGAHLNPAATLGLAINRRSPPAFAASYVLAQFAGSIAAAAREAADLVRSI
jgi:pimeloyl-ACP methyl ester carboxylesterase